jgi:hypothetical protein
MAETDDSDGESVEFTVDIADGETLIEMTGDRDTAVVVRSEMGERIYLPPEDFERPPETSDSPYQAARSDSPYQSAQSDSPYQATRNDSPYQSATRNDSPYQSARQQFPEKGMRSTRDGYTIRHPEAVTDVRVLR